MTGSITIASTTGGDTSGNIGYWTRAVNGQVLALDTISATGSLAIGNYRDVPTTVSPAGGSGLTVDFDITTVDTAPASITVKYRRIRL